MEFPLIKTARLSGNKESGIRFLLRTFAMQWQNLRLPDWLVRHAVLITFLIVLCALLAPMLRDGMWKGHDGSSHVLRLESTISALSEGQFPPVINSAQKNAFGYSWNLFYPPLSIYLAAATTLGVEVLGVSTPYAGFKLAWCLIILATTGSMFFFLNHVFRSRFAATVGTVLYISAPYFISCVYIRFALGEAMMFVFLPLLASGLYSIFHEKGEMNYLVSVGTLGIILSNIPASIILLMGLVVFSFLHAKYFLDKRVLVQLGLNVALTCGIAAFFYIPLLEQWMLENITAFVKMSGASLSSLQNEGVKFWWLILPRKILRMFFYYGFPILFCTLWLFFKVPQTRWTKTLAFCCVLLSFAMSKWMPWQIIPSVLDFIRYMQFPWRMLGMTLFLLCTLAAYNAQVFFKKENQPKTLVTLALCCIISAIFIFPSGRLHQIVRPETHTADYLPVKSLPYQKEFPAMKAVPSVSSGNAIISEVNKKGSALSFNVANVTKGTLIEMPFFAYLGYAASLKMDAGDSLPLELHESEKGLWSASLPEGSSGKVVMSYVGTKAARTSYRVSQCSLLLLLCYAFVCRRSSRTRKSNG